MTTVALGIPFAPVARPDRPDRPGLHDSFGRRATDLRVSLTDRCNLRCRYCMPAEGLSWLPKDTLLTDAELITLVRIAVTRLGVRRVRLTGGEPLLRPGLPDLVAAVAALTPRPDIALTSNGIGLAAQAQALAAAGLDRVNISLDSVDPETFAALTRRRRLPDVLAGLAAAHAAGLTPVKINAVLLRGINDTQAPDLLTFALEHGYQLRFIEQMPLEAGHGEWDRAQLVTAAEILDRLSGRFELRPHAAPRAGAPAELFDVLEPPARRSDRAHLRNGRAGPPEGTEPIASTDSPGRVVGTVGVIASVTRPFCGDCDRTRLTADGQVRDCLFAAHETDLRGLLRSGADDHTIAQTWRNAMWGKAAGHGMNDAGFAVPTRPMSAIGG